MSYNDGVRLDRDIPGTVISVKEALELIAFEVGLEPGARTVEEFVSIIDKENAARENAREAWERAEVELLDVTLIPGRFYDVTEQVGYYGRNSGKLRTARFCEYRGRKGTAEDNDRVTYHFARWGAENAKKRNLSYSGAHAQTDSWTARSIKALSPVEATPILAENVRLAKLPFEERQKARRDALGVTAAGEA